MPLRLEHTRRKRIVAIASGGGHWIQLCRLKDAFLSHEVIYIATDTDLADTISDAQFFSVQDANRDRPLDLLKCALQMFRLMLSLRPNVVISTGAAAGLFGIIFGKLFGATTIWVDSIANADVISLSGRLASPFANLWLTQWKHLARERGPRYRGSVL